MVVQTQHTSKIIKQEGIASMAGDYNMVDESDECSFVEFYKKHHGHHPSKETDKQYVNRLRAARKDSKERRNDIEFQHKFETWWHKKNPNEGGSSLWKEEMRSMVKFQKKTDGKQAHEGDTGAQRSIIHMN